MKELCKPLAAIVCAALVLLAASLALGPIRARTVSYTHLTLPTTPGV